MNPKTLACFKKSSPSLDQSERLQGLSEIEVFVTVGPFVPFAIDICHRLNMNFLGVIERSTPLIEIANGKELIAD